MIDTALRSVRPKGRHRSTRLAVVRSATVKGCAALYIWVDTTSNVYVFPYYSNHSPPLQDNLFMKDMFDFVA